MALCFAFTTIVKAILHKTNNNYVQAVVPEIRVQAGEYEHTINVPSGNYVVAYYLNGNINSKKVQVK